jgi:hypothetical protein
VQREDGGHGADRLADVDLAAGRQGRDVPGLAVADHDGRDGELVEQRPKGVRVAGPVGRVEVATGGHHVHLLGRVTQLVDGANAHDVRLARGGAHAEQGQETRPLELAVKLELAGGHVVEPTEVDVVAAGPQARPHRVDIDAVAGRVHEHEGVLQGLAQPLPGVDVPGEGLVAAVALGHRERALGVEVQQKELGHLLRLGEVAHDRRRDRPARAEHGDPHAATSSRARSASQNSIRSCARERSRPVSSSTRRMR